MIDECVVAVYDTVDKAGDAVQQLTDSGFPVSQVSLVTVDIKDDPKVLEELQLNDDSMFDAAAAAGLGGVLGTLVGLSVMTLSGVGLLFLVGPVGGGIVGSVAGAYIGALLGWGVHEHQLSRYQHLVEQGRVLLIANGDPVQCSLAHQILQQTAPSELHTYARSDGEASEID